MERRSTGLIVGGAILVSIGSLSTLIGAGVLLAQPSAEKSCSDASEVLVGTGGDPLDCSTSPTDIIIGASMLAGGLALIGGGIPMIVIGKERVPAQPGVALSITPVRAGMGAAFTVEL